MKKSVCIIGAGPSGSNLLVALAEHEKDVEVVCYEKNTDIGGQWLLDWRAGVNAHGEMVHSSMYEQLCINVPKPVMEYPDYSYRECFGEGDYNEQVWNVTYTPS